MRLKTFHANTLKEAMELVRLELGDEAIIVSAQEGDGAPGARVTAAIEREEEDFALFVDEPVDVLEHLTETLERHGTPQQLVDRLVNAAADVEQTDPVMVLAGALDEVFAFNPFPKLSNSKPIMLVGTPGAGKTVTAAKLAARAVVEGGKSSLIAADPIRACGVEQLKYYAERIGANLYPARDNEAFSNALAQCRRDELVIIDTPGTNPYDMTDFARLVELAGIVSMDIALVMPAGRDAEEAMDIAAAFRPLRPGRLIVTGIDMVRKLGSILAAADAGNMALSEVSPGPQIGQGLKPLNPVSLARLLLPEQAKDEIPDTGLHPTEDKALGYGTD